MTGESLKYLCAILNSTLIKWLVKNTALTTGLGLTQWKKFAVERLPIPKIFIEDQQPLICLVDEILKDKTSNPIANTSKQEAEINRLVYDLYSLTEREIAVIAREDKS